MSRSHIQAHTHTYVQLKRAVPVSVIVPKRVTSKWHLVVRSDFSRREEKWRPAVHPLTFTVAQTHKCEIIGKTGTNRENQALLHCWWCLLRQSINYHYYSYLGLAIRTKPLMLSVNLWHITHLAQFVLWAWMIAQIMLSHAETKWSD